jgi:hypothetical protein
MSSVLISPFLVIPLASYLFPLFIVLNYRTILFNTFSIHPGTGRQLDLPSWKYRRSLPSEAFMHFRLKLYEFKAEVRILL